MALRDVIYKLNQKHAQEDPLQEQANIQQQQQVNSALGQKHEELKASADQVAQEAEAQLEDTGLPPSMDEVFEKRRTAAKVRYIAALEKAYASLLQTTSTVNRSPEEAIARFEILAQSAEANFISELQGLIAEELEVRAKMDLDIVKQEQKLEQANKLQENKQQLEAVKKQQQDQAAQQVPIQQLGGVPSAAANPLAPQM